MRLAASLLLPLLLAASINGLTLRPVVTGAAINNHHERVANSFSASCCCFVEKSRRNCALTSLRMSFSASETTPVVEVYSSIGCKYCRIAKATLRKHLVQFVEIDIHEEHDASNGGAAVGNGRQRRSERIAHALGKTVPQIYVDEVRVGGCSDLLDAIADGSLFETFNKHNVPFSLPKYDGANSSSSLTDSALLSETSGELLNEKHVGEVPEELDLLLVAKDLQRQALRLCDLFATDDGRQINYKLMRRSRELRDYIQLSSLLAHPRLQEQVVEQLRFFSDAQKFSFFSNLYNAMIIHANCVIGPPEDSPTARSIFFQGKSGAVYRIGPWLFSPDEIEHGILRANRPHPSQPQDRSAFFDLGDTRATISIATDAFDPRIHFILNCGAASCPPIRILDATNLEVALAGAASAYLDAEVSVVPADDKDSCCTFIVHLPKLLMWYGKDFGNTMEDILRSVCTMLPLGTTRERLTNILSSIDPDADESSTSDEIRVGRCIVRFNNYDWATNDTSSSEKQ